MFNVINLDSRRPKPEPTPQFRHPFWERISKMDNKILTFMFIAAVAAAVVSWIYIDGGTLRKEMVELCKPDHYMGSFRVADGLYRVDCMNSTGQIRNIYQEAK